MRKNFGNRIEIRTKRLVYMKNRKIKKHGMLGLGISLLLICCGCSVEKTDGNKVEDLSFTVVEDKSVPEELVEEIEVRKEHDFKLTFEDGKKLYIVRGYGKKETGGYSIAVKDVYLTKNAIVFSSELIGPSENEKVAQEPTYPYVIVEVDNQGKYVVFE